jgi:hypothetical protein
MSEPGMQGPPRSETVEVLKGMGLTLLLHLIQVPFFMVSGGIALAGVGLSQLLYVLPAIFIFRSKGRPGIVKGIIIAAAITFLLNAACFGFIYLAMAQAGS